MESIEANKLIFKLQKDLAKSGIDKDKIVKGLKELRPYALEEGDPTLTKVIRLSYEYIEKNGVFNIPIPSDEEIDMEEEEVEPTKTLVELIAVTDVDAQKETLDYLFSLMLDQKNTNNRQDLFEYRDVLKAH